jgi:hypothetical protein
MIKLIAAATFVVLGFAASVEATARAAASARKYDHAGPRSMRRWQSADQWCLRQPALRLLRVRESPLLRLWDS